MSETKYRPSKQITAYLEQLKQSGMYGKTQTDVVQQIVRDHLLLLLKEGQLKKLE